MTRKRSHILKPPAKVNCEVNLLPPSSSFHPAVSMTRDKKEASLNDWEDGAEITREEEERSIEDENAQAAGKVGVNNSDFARTNNKVNRLINDLRSSGVGVDIKLPRIAVIGNQSAGKSSLIEALSAIRLPRATGTCTRTPTEVILENSTSAWKCQISIRYEDDEVDDEGQSNYQIKFGDVITDPSLVEANLRRAQLAILNPSVPALNFVNLDLDTLVNNKPPLGSSKQYSFSVNVVVIEISSPETTDLTFVDLPGIISNTSNPEDAGNIDLIRNMCVNYIKADCLILLTLTMRDDIDNQSAAALARKYDPLGKRTIGILTKPDTIADREEQPWLDILAGHSAPLKYGYHCTKQPSQVDLELNLTLGEYREAEKRFFATTEPWCSLDPRMKNQLGTENLTKFLSIRLGEYINERLPGMIKSINESYQAATIAIDNLPSPPSADPVLEIFALFSSFLADLDGFSVGSEGKQQLVQSANSAYARFARDIKSTTPRFIPWTAKEILTTPTKGDYREVDDEPMKDVEITGDDGGSLLASDSATSERLTCNLDDIRALIQSATSRELHGNSPYAVLSKTIANALKPWPTLVAKLLQSIRIPVQTLLEQLTEKHFGRYKNSTIRAAVLQTMMENVDVLFANAETHLLWLNQLNITPFTQNYHYLSDTRANLVASHNKTRQIVDISKANPLTVSNALAVLAAIGITGLAPKDLAKLFPPDPYSEEIDVMAQTAAYFKVARKVKIDVIPSAIDVDIIRLLSHSATDSLLARFELTGENMKQNAQHLLSETISDSEMREDLERKKTRLAIARKTLSHFGVSNM